MRDDDQSTRLGGDTDDEGLPARGELGDEVPGTAQLDRRAGEMPQAARAEGDRARQEAQGGLMQVTKQEAHEKLRQQLERGIILPEEYAQKCVEILTNERLEQES